MDVKPLLAGLRERVGEELDYTFEAESQRTFAAPTPTTPTSSCRRWSRSAGQVLVTEWVEGVPRDRVHRERHPEDRDGWARSTCSFLFSGPARAGLLHADPHPGNYRVVADGRLGVLDYGAVARVLTGFLAIWPASSASRSTVTRRRGRRPARRGLHQAVGAKVDRAALLGYLTRSSSRRGWSGSGSTAPGCASSSSAINDPRQEYWSVGLKLNLPPEYLLVHRVWLGGVGVLCQLGAEVPMRAELEQWLPGFADDPWAEQPDPPRTRRRPRAVGPGASCAARPTRHVPAAPGEPPAVRDGATGGAPAARAYGVAGRPPRADVVAGPVPAPGA